MYLNILKRDLKRKKTMNVILLIFVILSAMFMASSVNNILAVTSGLDGFFEKAGMADYFVLATNTSDDLKNAINDLDSVSDCRKEELIFPMDGEVKLNGVKIDNPGVPLYMPIENVQINCFDQSNEIINEVEKGTVYISGGFVTSNKLKVGDMVTVTIGETNVELKYMGRAKDALFGSDFMTNPRFIMNSEDFEQLNSDEKAKEQEGCIYYIDTTDAARVRATIGDFKGIAFHDDVSIIKNSYMMNMIVAGLLLVVSVFLIIISFVVLKHTIGFTIADEFREIGVMKAIGMKNSSIRTLYLIKYLAITVIGSAIGFFLSMPFSIMMLQSVTTTMYLESENNVLVAILCCLLVVVLTLLFCWTSTGKIKKLTPADAVRSGATGERFKKKSLMHLSKSKLGSSTFLAANDIVSAPKKYSVITSVFVILIMLVMVLANTANTLKSVDCLNLFGCTKSDVYIGVQSVFDKSAEGIEKILADNDMPGKVHIEKLYNIAAKTKDTKSTLVFQHSEGTDTSDYIYGEGVAPENANEVAISYLIAEQLEVKIGDEITLFVNGKERECIVTAFRQSFVQTGKACRLHQDFDLSDVENTGWVSCQVDFDDDPTEEVIEERIEKLKVIFDTDNVKNVNDYVIESLGVYDILVLIKNMILIIVLAIVVLIAVLMERSFISSEKAEIALMKAIGFSNKSIIWHHTLRFGIVAFIASMLAAVFCIPITKLTIDPIMGIMGAVSGVGYEIVPFEIFVLYPAILVTVAIISAFFTSIYTNTIKSSDASNIE